MCIVHCINKGQLIHLFFLLIPLIAIKTINTIFIGLNNIVLSIHRLFIASTKNVSKKDLNKVRLAN